MGELTALQRDILYVLSGLGHPAGVDIERELNDYYPSGIGNSRFYQSLNQLVDKGLVEKGSKNARTNEYSLTEEGRAWVREHLSWRRQYYRRMEIA